MGVIHMEEKITSKVFEDSKKKISYDISTRTLEMIDELAEITHLNRSMVLDSIFIPGIEFQANFMLETWKSWGKDPRYQDREKQDKLKKLIKDLENFQNKWDLNKMSHLLKKSADKSKH